MSLDLYIGEEESQESWNYTYNLSKMWRKASNDKRMIDIDGMTGLEAIVHIGPVVVELGSNPDTYKPMEPDNNWGSYVSFMLCLDELMVICTRNLENKWSSCR